MLKYQNTENAYDPQHVSLNDHITLKNDSALHFTSLDTTEDDQLLITVDRAVRIYNSSSEDLPLLHQYIFLQALGYKPVNGARFSSDKQNILAYGSNSPFCYVLPADLSSPKSVIVFDSCSNSSANPFHSHLFGLSGQSQSGVVDINERKLINASGFLPGKANCFIDRNTFIFSSKQRLYMWDIRTASASELQKNPFASNMSYSALAFNENVQMLSVGISNALFTFDMRNRQILNVENTLHSKEITSLSFSWDGLSILSCSLDKSVLLGSNFLDAWATFPNKANCVTVFGSISNHNSTIYTNSNHELTIWNVDLVVQNNVKSARSVNF